MTEVAWQHDVETSRLLYALALASFAAIGALFAAVGALAVLVLGGSLLAGELGVLALFAAAGLLFARRLAVQVAVAHEQDSPPVSWRHLAAASAAWAGLDAVLLAAGVPFEAVVVPHVVAVFVGLPLAAFLASEGAVDTERGVFSAGGGDTDLAAVEAVSRLDFGPASVLRVRYHDGTVGSSAPRWLGVPREDAGRVRDALESSDADPPASNSQPLVAAVLGAFGVGLLAFTGFLGYVAATGGGDRAVVVGYAAVVVGLFAWIFLWLAVRER